MKIEKLLLDWRRKGLAVLAMVASLWLVLGSNSVNALQLTLRSVEVASATPSAVTNHLFRFTYASASALGSVVFEYCDNSPLPAISCNAPVGLNVLTASLSAQSGNTGFSIDGVNTTANKLVITRAPSAASAVPSSYNFSGITNPSAGGTTEFVRISTYASTDGSGPLTDNGSVAFATITPVSVGATVPPFLSLCVAITVALNCSSANGSSLDLGTFVTNQPKSGTSQFAVATNSVTGDVVYALGTTMTSGNNTIASLSTPTPSLPGNSQFGINLRDNSSPDVGENPAGLGTASPTPDYNIPNFYTFQPGAAIASTVLPSDYTRLSVSYVVNINASQPLGVYNTTVTYLGIAQF